MKNIIICCDGTGQDLDGKQSNVLQFYRSLQPSEDQICFYEPGVGTVENHIGAGANVARKLDGAFGYSVQKQACCAYKFLVNCWEPQDKIYILGFSRGAYSARVLAAMIRNLGLLTKEHEHLVNLGWKHDSQTEWHAMRRFKRDFAHQAPTRIHFVGVWDTVSSFGPMTNPRLLPSTANNDSIDHIRHAVAIDEKRACFASNHFGTKSKKYCKSFKEVFFPGVHGDVGGGLEESGLSKIALKWMYDEARDLDCMLDESMVNHELGRSGKKTKPNPLAPIGHSLKSFWWLLEFIPRRNWNGKRMKWRLPNYARPRRILPSAEFHESVAIKLEEDPTYAPRNLPRPFPKE